MRMKHALLATVIGCMLLVCGCQGIPYLMAALAPPEEVEAKYDLDPSGRLLLLVVDSPQCDPAETVAVHRHLTRQLTVMLLANEATGSVVSYDELLDLRIANPRKFEEWTPAEIAKELEADQIVQVRITKFGVKDDAIDEIMWHGQMEASVEVIDLNGKTVWPDDRLHGFPAEPVEIRRDNEATPAYTAKLTKLLSVAMADNVSKYFYDHEVGAYEHNRDARLEDMRGQGLFIE
jgi:hypothetical protein